MNARVQSLIHRRLPIIGIAAALLLALGWIWHSESTFPPQRGDTSVLVSTITAEQRNIPRILTFYGLVTGLENVPVYADLTRGTIINVLAEPGQFVKAGTTLAVIDNTVLKNLKAQQIAAQQHARAEVSQAETRLNAAKIQLAQAKSENSRSALVADSGFFSDEVLNQKAVAERLAESHVKTENSNLAIAQADLAMATAQVALTDLNLKRSTITAPVSGTIIERKAVVGLSGETAAPLFLILRNKALAVELVVPSKEASTLKQGMPVDIQIAGSARSISGRIRQAAARIEAQEQVARVQVEFDQAPEAIPGQSARISLHLSGNEAIYLPETAISFDGSSPSVFSIRDGKAMRLPISTGERTGEWVEIVSGVSAGTKVIDRFAEFLHDGEPVRLTDPDTPASPNVHSTKAFELQMSLSCRSCEKT